MPKGMGYGTKKSPTKSNKVTKSTKKPSAKISKKGK